MPQLNAPPSTQVEAPPTGLHGAPEVGRRRLIRDVLHLPGQLPALNPVEPLPGELEVVALHVDRPALVAHDVDAAVDPGDQVLGARARRPRQCASDTFAMRWIGTCIGESAKAHPFERSNPMAAAMERSSW